MICKLLVIFLLLNGAMFMAGSWLCAESLAGETLHSPHNLDDDSCVSCHSGGRPHQPVPETTREIEQSLHSSRPDSEICNRCHVKLTGSHFNGQNPFLDPTIIRGFQRPAGSEGEELCLDCHAPHGEDGNAFLLSNRYFRLCQLSRSINPHWRELMCNSCHLNRFPEGDQTVLLNNGDVDAICNRCHHSTFARREIHPVGITPSPKVKVPDDMPLRGGKLTCSTCHHCALQKFAPTDRSVGRQNRNFLRHNSLSRVEYCFLCHVAETYTRLNPHRQLDDSGKITEQTCLFCHASRPDAPFASPDRITFLIANPVSYCVGCHPGFEHKHPSGGEHMVAPSAKILRSLSTSEARIGVSLPLHEGKIVCTTCHNPHEKGVIKVHAAAEGAGREHKLRLMPGKNQCTGCHWDI